MVFFPTIFAVFHQLRLTRSIYEVGIELIIDIPTPTTSIIPLILFYQVSGFGGFRVKKGGNEGVKRGIFQKSRERRILGSKARRPKLLDSSNDV